MKIEYNIYVNEELFSTELAIHEDAIGRGVATDEVWERYKDLLAIKDDPEAMAFIRAQRWGSNR